jgi:hypothetical protein
MNTEAEYKDNTFDFNEIETSFDFDIGAFGFETDPEKESRYIKPPLTKQLPDRLLKFSNAEKLAKAINFNSGESTFALLAGNFVFCDFIEAFFYQHNIYTDRLQISTLSLAYDNIIILKNLMNGGFVQNFDLIISSYFYSHERHNLIKEIYKELDFGDRFQLAVAAIHTKMVSFKTEGGKHILISGSANLRSSNNVEQIYIQDNKEIFNFVTDFNNRIIETYKTIRKPLLTKKIWQIQEEAEPEETKEAADHH